MYTMVTNILTTWLAKKYKISHKITLITTNLNPKPFVYKNHFPFAVYSNMPHHQFIWRI